MGKASKSHPWAGQTVYFGTRHGKARAVQGGLKALGIRCVTARIDTDAFGTFSGSVPRVASIRETLQAKVQKVFEQVPQARFALASEGSFGPHPLVGIPSDHEAMLWSERDQPGEIFVDHLSTQVHHFELVVEPGGDALAEIQKTRFPSHALTIRVEGEALPLNTVIRSRHRLEEALRRISKLPGPPRRLYIGADLRAHFNPTRMEVIRELGVKLVERISSLCTICETPGFWPERAGAGVPCPDCGTPTRIPAGHTWGCRHCGHEEHRADPLAPGKVHAGICQNCNP